MGRIKSLMIKKAAKQLLGKDNSFNDKFDHNKRVLHSTMPSKPIRNKIAGYIARLKRMEKEFEIKEKKRKEKEALKQSQEIELQYQ